MLILLDHATPRPLRRHLPGHTVHTAAQMGWDLLSDGTLLTIAEEAGYNLLITPDQKNPAPAKSYRPKNRYPGTYEKRLVPNPTTR